jgi:hypothetical protein
MKIGVFGDSYADKMFLNESTPKIWYNFLHTEYGHSIECFGEGGSSILFSVELLKEHANNYDLVIWCLTTPGRFSFPKGNGQKAYHVTTAWDRCKTDNVDLIKKHKICIDYLKYIFDWDTENLIGKSLVSYMQSQFSNLMIIPCFPPPLESIFNLYELCEQEAQHYFPGQKIYEIYKNYQDIRPGHITEDNQKILARLINDNLGSGVFQSSYDHFVKPSLPFNQVFKPKL